MQNNQRGRGNMKDINDLMPKLPKNSFAALLNFIPNKAEAHQLLKTFPFDSRWHTFDNSKDSVVIDGKTTLKQNAKRFT